MSNLFEFEVGVQELAGHLAEVEAGMRLNAGARELAENIADTINDDRQAVIDAYSAESNPHLLYNISSAIKLERAKPFFERDDATKAALGTLKNDIEEDAQHHEQMGFWVEDVVPKSDHTQVSAKHIIDSLFGYPELAFSNEDYALAESYLGPVKAKEPKPTVRAKIVTPVIETPALPEIIANPEDLKMELAGDLLNLMVGFKLEERPRTKINVRVNEFRDVLIKRGIKADKTLEKELFHDSWELIEATIKECDPTFDAFTHDGGNTRGRQYLLNDPELVILAWEDQGDEDPEIDIEPATIADESMLTITTVESEQTVEFTPEQTNALAILKDKKKNNTYIGVNHLVKMVEQSSDLPRAEVSKQVKSLIRQLGDQIEGHFSSRKVKRLVRLR